MNKAIRIILFIFSQIFFIGGIPILIYVTTELNTLNVFIENRYTFINYWLWLIIALILIGISIAMTFLSRMKHLALILERDILLIILSLIALLARIVITSTMPTIYTAVGYILAIVLFVYTVSIMIVNLLYYRKSEKL